MAPGCLPWFLYFYISQHKNKNFTSTEPNSRVERFHFPLSVGKKNPIHHHNQTSPVIFRGLRREDEKDTREKRKNVNEPAGSSFSFYPSRVGALREKDPLDFWCIDYEFVMSCSVSRCLLIHFENKNCCSTASPEAGTWSQYWLLQVEMEFLGKYLARIQHGNCRWCWISFGIRLHGHFTNFKASRELLHFGIWIDSSVWSSLRGTK